MVAIAQVVEAFAYGTAKSVRQLCGLLSPADRVTVFYGQRQGTELDLKELDPRVQWQALPGKGKTKHFTNLRHLEVALSKSFDIVHGHSSYGGLYAKLLGPRLGLTTLYSPRGFAFLREDFPTVGRWGFRQIERLTSGRCLTVCCGPYEHKLAKSLGGPTIQINNGFVVEMPFGIDSIGDYILGVGRICHQKGFDIFVETARRLPMKRFTWVGEAQKANEPLLNGLPSNLTLYPYIDHAILLNMIRRSRMILLPSRWEGLSRFLIESVCLGKAVVTSRFPANLDCLDPTGPNQYSNGFACQAIEEYVRAVRHLSEKDECLYKMQSASHDYAQENFDIRKITSKWRDLYYSFNDQTQASQKAGCTLANSLHTYK